MASTLLSRWDRVGVAVIAATLVVLIVGCASPPPKVRVSVLEPAASADATRLKRVAVMQFGQRNRMDVTGDVEAVLAGVVVHDRRFYEVVERRRLDALLSEIKRGETGMLDRSTVASLGKMVGAAGVYTGELTRAETADQSYTEPRSICAQREIKRDKKGNTYEGGCARWSNTTARCTARTANFAFSVRLVRIETGEIVYSATHDGEAKSSGCREPATREQKQITPAQQLLIDAKEIALGSFRRDIAPTVRMRSIELLGPGEHIEVSAHKERFNGALAFAKEGRMDRACEIWGDIAKTAGEVPELVYDLGVCAEVNGDMDEAMRLYRRADALLTTPVPAISDALMRVQTDIEASVKLRSQLRR